MSHEPYLSRITAVREQFTGWGVDGLLIVSPTNSRERMLEMIDGADRSIDFYAEVIRDPEIIAAIGNAVDRGVSVRLIVDQSIDADSQDAALHALADAEVHHQVLDTGERVVDETGRHAPEHQFRQRAAEALTHCVEALRAAEAGVESPDEQGHADEEYDTGRTVRDRRPGGDGKPHGADVQINGTIVFHAWIPSYWRPRRGRSG